MCTQGCSHCQPLRDTDMAHTTQYTHTHTQTCTEILSSPDPQRHPDTQTLTVTLLCLTHCHTVVLVQLSKMCMDPLLCPVHIAVVLSQRSPRVVHNPMCFLSTRCHGHTSTSAHTVTRAWPLAGIWSHTHRLIQPHPYCPLHTSSHHDVWLHVLSHTAWTPSHAVSHILLQS